MHDMWPFGPLVFSWGFILQENIKCIEIYFPDFMCKMHVKNIFVGF